MPIRGHATACRAFYRTWFVAFYGNTAAAGKSKGDFCGGTPASLANKIASIDRYTLASLGEYNWEPALSVVQSPTLVIHGTADAIAVSSAIAWAAALPNARLLLVDGVGHFPYLEAPEAFFSAVERFVQGEWPQAAHPVARSP